MRRDTFLKSLAALAATGALPLSASAAANRKMMIPANPGGGWDTTGRALGKALQDAGVATAVTYENKGVVEQMKKDIGSVKWGGGSRGSTEHIAAAMLARDQGLDASKINYVPFRGGGEAVAAILGGNVTVGGSGYSEFQQYIESGKMRAIAVTSGTRLKGINIPTMKEQGYNVEIGNWRGVYGAPGITPEQRKALVDMIVKATKSKAWSEAMEKNNWTPALLTGKEFEDFVDREFAGLRATMVKAGMV